MIAKRFRVALASAVQAAFADQPSVEEIRRLFAAAEREYAALSWWERKYADLLVWRCNRVVERVYQKHGITV